MKKQNKKSPNIDSLRPAKLTKREREIREAIQYRFQKSKINNYQYTTNAGTNSNNYSYCGPNQKDSQSSFRCQSTNSDVFECLRDLSVVNLHMYHSPFPEEDLIVPKNATKTGRKTNSRQKRLVTENDRSFYGVFASGRNKNIDQKMHGYSSSSNNKGNFKALMASNNYPAGYNQQNRHKRIKSEFSHNEFDYNRSSSRDREGLGFKKKKKDNPYHEIKDSSYVSASSFEEREGRFKKKNKLTEGHLNSSSQKPYGNFYKYENSNHSFRDQQQSSRSMGKIYNQPHNNQSLLTEGSHHILHINKAMEKNHSKSIKDIYMNALSQLANKNTVKDNKKKNRNESLQQYSRAINQCSSTSRRNKRPNEDNIKSQRVQTEYHEERVKDIGSLNYKTKFNNFYEGGLEKSEFDDKYKPQSVNKSNYQSQMQHKRNKKLDKTLLINPQQTTTSKKEKSSWKSIVMRVSDDVRAEGSKQRMMAGKNQEMKIRLPTSSKHVAGISSKRRQVESFRERMKTPRLNNPLQDKGSSSRAMYVHSERQMRSESKRSNSSKLHKNYQNRTKQQNPKN